MPKILLINSSFTKKNREFSNFGPPLGILSIASALIEAEYDVTFIDPQVEDNYIQLMAEALDDDIVFVGFSVYLGENISNAIELTEHIKSLHKNIPVVWGGPVASSLPETCIREGRADYVVMGPGERTVVELAKNLTDKDHKKIHEHPNICLLTAGNTFKRGLIHKLSEDIDSLPRIRLELWGKGLERTKSIPLISSRGCPYKCSFCYNTFTDQGRYLLRSTESVLEEMDYWHQKLGYSSFIFMDDNFLINEKRALEILKATELRGYSVGRIYGHLSNFTPAIQDAICDKKISVTMCIESGSEKIRRLLNKPINIEKALNLIKNLTAHGVSFVTAFMFGLPGEDNTDILNSMKVANEIRKISNGNALSMFYLYSPQPDDLIISNDTTKYKDKIEFTLDNLAGVEVIPAPPTDQIDIKIRPWMSEDDASFYKALTVAWLYNFVPHYRQQNQNLDMGKIIKSSARLSRLLNAAEAINT